MINNFSNNSAVITSIYTDQALSPWMRRATFWYDCHSLSMDGTQVCFFKKSYQVSLCSFLKSTDCSALETQICLEILCNFTNEALKGQLADQQFSGLLAHTKSNCSLAVAVGLLDTRTCCWCSFEGNLLCLRLVCSAIFT